MKKLVLINLILIIAVMILGLVASIASASMNWFAPEGMAPAGRQGIVSSHNIDMNMQNCAVSIQSSQIISEEIILENPVEEESFVERCQYEKISFGRSI